MTAFDSSQTSHAPCNSQRTRIRVLCVDDSPDILGVLSRLIQADAELEDLGGLLSADGLVDEVERRGAHVVLLDLSMPGESPLEALRSICAGGRARVIVLTGRSDPETEAMVLAAGARAVLSKGGEPREITRTIRRIAAE